MLRAPRRLRGRTMMVCRVPRMGPGFCSANATSKSLSHTDTTYLLACVLGVRRCNSDRNSWRREWRMNGGAATSHESTGFGA